jgi:hypothetical protein
MERTIALTKIFLFLFLISSYFISAQGKEKDSLSNGWERISYNKEKIYILFKDSLCDWQKKFYSKREKGVIFNLGCKNHGSCLYRDKSKADTLDMKNINQINTITMEDVVKKVSFFRRKTYKKLPPKPNSKLYQAYDNNDIFETYLIEAINQKQFVVYPVFWRNQRVLR